MLAFIFATNRSSTTSDRSLWRTIWSSLGAAESWKSWWKVRWERSLSTELNMPTLSASLKQVQQHRVKRNRKRRIQRLLRSFSGPERWCSPTTHAVFSHPDCSTVWLMYVGFVHLPIKTTSRRSTHKLVCVHTLSLNPGVMWDQRLTRFGTARVYDYWRVAVAWAASLWLALSLTDRPSLTRRHWAEWTFCLDYTGPEPHGVRSSRSVWDCVHSLMSGL